MNHGASFSPKPCAHCGGTSFHVLPDVQLEVHKLVTVLGLPGAGKVPGWWRLTLVICAQCTHTEFFTPNVAELVKRIPGAYTATARATR